MTAWQVSRPGPGSTLTTMRHLLLIWWSCMRWTPASSWGSHSSPSTSSWGYAINCPSHACRCSCSPKGSPSLVPHEELLHSAAMITSKLACMPTCDFALGLCSPVLVWQSAYGVYSRSSLAEKGWCLGRRQSTIISWPCLSSIAVHPTALPSVVK